MFVTIWWILNSDQSCHHWMWNYRVHDMQYGLDISGQRSEVAVGLQKLGKKKMLALVHLSKSVYSPGSWYLQILCWGGGTFLPRMYRHIQSPLWYLIGHPWCPLNNYNAELQRNAELPHKTTTNSHKTTTKRHKVTSKRCKTTTKRLKTSKTTMKRHND